VEGTAAFLRTEGFAAPARSMSTLLLLKRNGALSITEIAYWLKLSHPLIIKLTKGLADAGYVKQQSDPKDNRRRMISLTAKGAQQADRVEEFTLTLADTFQDLFKDMVRISSRRWSGSKRQPPIVRSSIGSSAPRPKSNPPRLEQRTCAP
jgi:DNA-binding MarR family transcriptional regulator